MATHPKGYSTSNAVALHLHRWWVVVIIAGLAGLTLAALRFVEWVS